MPIYFNVEYRMNIKDISAAMMFGLGAAVPAVGSTGETLAEETRGMALQTALSSMQAIVVAVDAETQMTTVLGPRGEPVQVPLMRVTDGSPLSQGDAVALQYRNATGVEIDEAAHGDHGVRRRVNSTTTVPVGQGYVVEHQAEISATIEHIDEEARELTVLGVLEQRTVIAPPDLDLTQYKRGDRVNVVFVTHYSLQPMQA
jgi:hypothetical protein